ncbi:MAG: arylesterase [Gallionellaceae bacterium CG1_02_60_325]|nr:MAG: arylesterase [Gallionellaceae bacterium CG1_02_60_325]
MKLPAMICLLLLALSGNARAAQNILVFGDSLSAGYGIARADSWVNLLQSELAGTHPQFAVVNASLSGETTAGGLRRIDQALRQHRPAIVILELGANDGLRGTPLSATEHNLGQIIALIQRAKAKVLLLGMRLPPNYGPDYTRQFAALYPVLAKKYRVARLPFMLDGITPEQFQTDNLHPDASAQPRIMQNIFHALIPLL